MPTDIDIDELDRLLDGGATLVEVLPKGEFDEEHLPEAVNLPLRDLTRESISHIDRGSPVVVYCWDSL